jgi:hypothetical protein
VTVIDYEKRRAEVHARVWPPREDEIDTGILPLCKSCWAAGIETALSCDGHKERHGYIMFWSEAEARAAMKVLAAYDP